MTLANSFLKTEALHDLPSDESVLRDSLNVSKMKFRSSPMAGLIFSSFPSCVISYAFRGVLLWPYIGMEKVN